ncbi:MAG: T9SS type A sorting domain-containing protein [Flavobacteriaceae bacterium]|nr:T9SS type A sorting domain-containing protein [Flavobacteriaceae bacterium]
MKFKLFLLFSFFISCHLFAQIEVGFINNFEDGTTQGWINGGTSPNPPTNIPTGGPEGENDSFLEEISSGGSGEGSKLIVFNVNPEWQGDYNVAGVNQISFYAKNGHTEDLFLRIGMSGGVGSRMVTTEYVSLPASQTTWTYLSIPIAPNDFTMFSGPNTPDEVLANVNGLRIISNPNISYYGQSIEATLHLDNITTENILSIEDLLEKTFSFYPNPASQEITIISHNDSEISVLAYSVLGEEVFNKNINTNQTKLNISDLKKGVYFLKIASSQGWIIKKLIKN